MNQEAGFSIATYTGSTASGALTVGHGLGKKPAVVIVKKRDGTGDWVVGHQGLATNAFANSKFLKLDVNNGVFTNSLVWGAEPTTTVTQIVSNGAAGASNLTSSGTYVMYSWTEIPGYSKFGSFQGNGNANGPFVFTGFRPAMIFYKRVDASDNWGIHDNKRDVDNPIQRFLYPDDTYAEWTGGTNDHVDFLSNGFKIRNSGSMFNQNNHTIVYWAFAETSHNSPNGGQSRAR